MGPSSQSNVVGGSDRPADRRDLARPDVARPVTSRAAEVPAAEEERAKAGYQGPRAPLVPTIEERLEAERRVSQANQEIAARATSERDWWRAGAAVLVILLLLQTC
jgi:hypothetical protein